MKRWDITTGIVSSIMFLPFNAQAAFLDDANSSLTLQNYFFESDFRNEKTAVRPQQSKKEEWAQGATFDFRSGYTEGKLGVGIDAFAMLGFKLYSDPESSGTGLLPLSKYSLDGQPQYVKEAKDTYTKFGLTAKLKLNESVLKYGALIPEGLPVLLPNTARLFPQYFQGLDLDSKDIEKLHLKAGWIDRVKQRDATEFESLGIDTGYTRYTQSQASDHFSYAGLDYEFKPKLIGSYYFSQLSDTYNQYFLGLKHSQSLDQGKISSDLRYFNSTDTGTALAGEIDTKMYTSSFTYQQSQHTFNVGFQKVDGNQALPYLKGAGPYTPTTVMVSYFILPHEETWWMRYDYRFSDWGLPGLVFSTKYLHGSKIKLKNSPLEHKEWERDTELAYTVQTGRFKDLSFRLRHASFRSSLDRGIDQTRMLITYTFHFK